MATSMVITDLDGTLLRNDRTVSARDRQTLEHLGGRGVLRVVATGRSLASARRVLPPDFPIDYLIFSTGSGVLDWHREKVIVEHGLDAHDVTSLFDALASVEADLQIHARIPDNHHFLHYGAQGARERQLHRWDRACCERGAELKPHTQATQILLMYPPEAKPKQDAAFVSVSSAIPDFRAVRVTSPRDGVSMWIEVFTRAVSKSQAASWLAGRHGISSARCLAIGNDYNDRDLLLWAGCGVAVGNAISELREAFPVVSSNEEDGLSEAVQAHLRE